MGGESVTALPTLRADPDASGRKEAVYTRGALHHTSAYHTGPGTAYCTSRVRLQLRDEPAGCHHRGLGVATPVPCRCARTTPGFLGQLTCVVD